MTIQLSKILEIEQPDEYKVHLACWNGEDQPLDVFVRDKSEWDGWNSWRSGKNEFNRRYILSLIDFYPEPGVWLFGGIYEVIERKDQNYSHSYTVKKVNLGSELIGRIKIKFDRPGRIRSIKLERYFNQMEISEILKEPYSGEQFPGYDNISFDFTSLEAIFKTHRLDWKTALENIKGVYVIFDKLTGKKYVGSAYGDYGIWSRWSVYIETGHGWNDELTKLIEKEGIDYARRYFRVTLLEYRSMRTDDNVIIERENYWKEALFSRGKFGYNKN